MTCGICNPTGFQDSWASHHWIEAKSPRVWGYAVSPDPTKLAGQVRHLLYYGAGHVFADVPGGQVRHRPGFKALTNPAYLREGDTLLLAHKDAMGTKPKAADKILASLHTDGVNVQVVELEDPF